MKNPVLPEATRASLLARRGILAIIRSGASGTVPEVFVAVRDDGSITGFNSHVDIGTGIRTSLAQIVAEELNASFERVAMMLGDTEWTPNQGPTIASETIQVAAVPLRHAAAQARHILLALAAERFGVGIETLTIEAGEILATSGGNLRIGFGELVAEANILVELDLATPVKPPEQYRVVGTSVRRVDIAAKATGELVFVHDLRLPGMLHGRVVRPPYAGRDSGAFVGHSLVSVDEGSIAHIPGIVRLVVIHDFIGIVAEREDQAEAAARDLVVDWGPFSALPDLNNPAQAIRDNPRTTRKLVDRGDTDAALEQATTRLRRTYVWPYQMHGSIGPSCSVAAFDDAGRLTVWSGTQTQQMLRADLATLLQMAEQDIEIIRMEASGSYGRNSMDDAGADAALLARAVGRPVRVQLTREQEHMWEPKGSAQLMEVDGGIDAAGNLLAYDYQSSYPSNVSPALAVLLTRAAPPLTDLHTSGDRTAIPPYAYPNLRIRIHDMPPIARASFIRGVSALPTSFAHDAYIDELAEAAGADPVAYRLRAMRDARAIDLLRAVAARADWVPHVGARRQPVDENIVRGQGVAQAVYVHGPWPGTAAAWSAWVTEVEVNQATGEVAVTRAVVGQDSGMMINPDGVRHQIQGNVIQATSRVLKEQVSFDSQAVTSREWGSYPILRFPELPRIDVIMMPRPHDPPLGAGESASVPSAAAIVNAVYDATGVRFRELPLTPERVLEGLGRRVKLPPATVTEPVAARRTPPWKSLLAGAGALLSAGMILWPLKPAIAPIAPPARDVYSSEEIERGRILAAAGDCVVCHTDEAGVEYAGGRAIDTPFGVVYSTNLTPDPETGIGHWSYPAFERAMRLGISRDGRHLYPAFPYTSFTRMTDADLAALYAYLMAQPAVRSRPPATTLAYPFGARALLAGWNGLFLTPGAYRPDPARSAEWNRGAYLVEAVGHCSACHTPRNALGAEKGGIESYGGAVADGWEAPALGALSRAPVPWTETELYAYLRTGASDIHGPAGGPMAPVIEGLRAVPDADIRAMTVYLASLAPPAPAETGVANQVETLVREGDAALAAGTGPGGRLFDGACAVCHLGSAPDMFGARLSLALNSNVHSARPDNLIRVILEGMADPANPRRGAMPAFRYVFDDRQIADLTAFIRGVAAPGKPAWNDLEAVSARIRAERVPTRTASHS